MERVDPPSTWSGTWTGSSWGVNSEHHPRSHSHGELDPDWHPREAPGFMAVLQQIGRNLELLCTTDIHESRPVATSSRDGSRMIFTGGVAIYYFDVAPDQRSMTDLDSVCSLMAIRRTGDIRQ